MVLLAWPELEPDAEANAHEPYANSKLWLTR
jgi:hypothetical protein